MLPQAIPGSGSLYSWQVRPPWNQRGPIHGGKAARRRTWILIMPISIMDACAMLAFLQNEPGADVVEEVLTRRSEMCLAHAVNLCEVYYKICGRSGEATAKSAISDLATAGIIERDDMDAPFWREAGKQRAAILASGNQIALADCFTIAL